MSRVVFDNTFLTRIWQRNAPAPEDPETNAPLQSHNERLDFLLESLEGEGSKVIITTPALTELLLGIKGRSGQELLEEIDGSGIFEIKGFNRRAAVEASILMQVHRSFSGRKANPGAWQKIKVDWQIVAIAKVENVSTIYSDDPDVKSFAETANLNCVSLPELPLPPEEPQQNLPFDGASEQANEKQTASDSEPEPDEVSGGSDGSLEGEAAAESGAKDQEEGDEG